jgi:Cof subfamily protein (haloacid dehalogenase superfamily)
MKKALFFDIDGTLLGADHKVPKSASLAISAARKRGCLVFINSGRCMGMLNGFDKKIELDGILAGCGTEIVIDGEIRENFIIPEDLRQRLIKADRKYNVDIILEGTDGNHYREGKSRFPVVNEIRAMTEAIGAVSHQPFESKYEISKFCLQADDASDMSGLTSEFGSDFDIIDRGEGFFECVPKGFSKGSALIKTLEYTGVGPDDAYCFGDSSNDLSMFQSCRHAIAMKDHSHELDPYTEYVTDSPENDGIMKALKKSGII